MVLNKSGLLWLMVLKIREVQECRRVENSQAIMSLVSVETLALLEILAEG